MKAPSNFKVSTRHLKIDKSNQQIVIAVSVTTALIVFALISVNAIFGQLKYQQLVLNKRNEANEQLESNYKAAQTLFASFQAFESTPESMIGTADKNSKVVLDALPSKYDFPAYAVYMQELLNISSVNSTGFSGRDEEASAQQESDNPIPIEMPASFDVQGDINSAKGFVDNLYRSVKPIKIKTFTIKGSDNAMSITIDGISYYQPQKNYKVESVVVKPSGSNKQSAGSTTEPANDNSTAATGVQQ